MRNWGYRWRNIASALGKAPLKLARIVPRDSLPENLGEFVARVRKQTAKPLCVGFGISTADQARQLAGIADGVIVGSRIIQLLEADNSLKDLGDFTKQLRQALDQLNKA